MAPTARWPLACRDTPIYRDTSPRIYEIQAPVSTRYMPPYSFFSSSPASQVIKIPFVPSPDRNTPTKLLLEAGKVVMRTPPASPPPLLDFGKGGQTSAQPCGKGESCTIGCCAPSCTWPSNSLKLPALMHEDALDDELVDSIAKLGDSISPRSTRAPSRASRARSVASTRPNPSSRLPKPQPQPKPQPKKQF